MSSSTNSGATTTTTGSSTPGDSSHRSFLGTARVRPTPPPQSAKPKSILPTEETTTTTPPPPQQQQQQQSKSPSKPIPMPNITTTTSTTLSNSPKTTPRSLQPPSKPLPLPSEATTANKRVLAGSARNSSTENLPQASQPLTTTTTTTTTTATTTTTPSSPPTQQQQANNIQLLPAESREVRTMSNPDTVASPLIQSSSASQLPSATPAANTSNVDSPVLNPSALFYVAITGDPLPYQVPGRNMLVGSFKVSVPYTPTLTLKDVREQVCAKKGLQAAAYRFDGQPNLSITIASLGIEPGSFKLRLSKIHPDAPLVLRVTFENDCGVVSVNAPTKQTPGSKHAMQTLGIKYEGGRSMRDIKEIICEKRRLNPSEFVLKFEGVDVICGSDVTLGMLGISAVRLCKAPPLPGSKEEEQKAPRSKARRPYLERRGNRVVVPAGDGIVFTVVDGERIPTKCTLNALLRYLFDSFPPEINSIEEFCFIFSYLIQSSELFQILLDVYNGKPLSDNKPFQSDQNQIKLSVLLFLRCWIDCNFSSICLDRILFGKILSFLLSGTVSSSTNNEQQQQQQITLQTVFWSLIGLIHEKLMTRKDLSELVEMMRNDPTLPFMRDPDGKDTTLFFTGWQALDWLRTKLALDKHDSLFLGQMLMDTGFLRTNSRTTQFSDDCQLYFQGEGTGIHSRILDFSASEFAQQLTLFMSTMFRSIDITTELCHQAWTRQNSTQGVQKILDMSDRLTLWIVAEIINQQSSRKRLEALRRVVQIASECLANNSFGALSILVTALQHPSITRMKQIWSALSMRKRENLLELVEQVSHADGFREYRQKINSLLHAKQRVPIVPLLDAHLQEIRYIESNRTMTDDGQQIEYWKMHLLSQALGSLLMMQEIPYQINFAIVLQRALVNAGSCTLTGEELYATSCFVEPNQSEPHPKPFPDLLRSLEYVKLSDPSNR